MHHSIGKVLPADGYRTTKMFDLSDEQYQALYQLYQPIIGIEALSLYMTLYHQIAFHDRHSHHYLMQLLNQSLTTIYDARTKIEAIGLLETYRYEDDQQTLYDFHLKSPMTPVGFMSDDVLSQMLYHQIGKQKFQSLKSKILERTAFTPSGEPITHTFSDVFLHQPVDIEMDQTEETAKIKHQPKRQDWITDTVIDFDWLSQNLQSRMLNDDVILSRDNQRFINQMAVLYNLSNSEVDKLLQWSIDSEHRLDKEAFKEACLDAIDVQPSKQQVITQRERLKKSEVDDSPTTAPQSKKARFIEQMETLSPKELIEDLSGEAAASTQDIKMIADIMEKQALSPGVMNVLIHYVMLKSDMKLSRAYMEKIASHWARKQIKTVTQAMALAKEEHTKYQSKDFKKSYPRKRSGREAVVPEWFKKQKTEPNKTNQQPSGTDQPASDDGQEIDALLKSFQAKKKKQ
ncbi:replication initiation and membrane attachment protein [Halolactibacillus miurensis]|uniref:Replication initiation and membrane attachment protein n=2 Tax=Halolactibacillus TaxID=306539 RepID=A0A1I6U7V8_9BACI|nr:DnaD domain protein [Halolactibacillus miurensis]GEM05014.1 replication initiation and membrane attachment protein [Halolactibacillus miurensis]SFS97540.1 replicative DNA helicase loader DnaB [Halolactibacillus miurensis]